MKGIAALAATLLAIACLAATAHAASPFGVGLPEPAPSGGGFLPGLFHWIAVEQRAFYKAMTGEVGRMKADGTAGVWLMGLSFAYGVLHAAGPGHGKAIVSAYVLANRETARNGAVLALLSSLAQAVTAIVLVTIAAFLLGATSMAMTRTAEWLELGSFLLITGLGLWLVWRKIIVPVVAWTGERYAPVLVTVAAGEGHGGLLVQVAHHRHDGHAHHHDGSHNHHGSHHHHDHGPDCSCGHGHAPTLEQASGRLDLVKAWSTIAAVGLRPCTGALIVLVFALSQGLYWAGMAATVAMALGTGLTVATLTLLAVSARGVAERLSGANSTMARRVHVGFEALGAVVVLGFGLLMLGASLTG
ncbi:nickel/cobalt transporter [Chthonobacter albigriseus]|uniref:nickel/cobalt transporter n=1 Tax=Chthonobacter albigriseus TaxID=1683161 RepID=UPI0015EE4E4F|nr:nickel/cobalt transporter [Chthonobacter albigriseus]